MLLQEFGRCLSQQDRQIRQVLNAGRYLHSCMVLDNGNVLVAGGIDASHHVLRSVEVFDMAANTWLEEPGLPEYFNPVQPQLYRHHDHILALFKGKIA